MKHHSTKRLSDEALLETVRAWRDAGESKTLAGKALGLTHKTVWDRLQAAKARGFLDDGAPPQLATAAALPTFPDDDISAEEILDHMAARFGKKKAAADARKWFSIAMKDTAPTALVWFGDPHLGSNGCNIPLLRRDVAIVRDTPGMFGANIGDTVDNWEGRLIRLYAENDVSRSTERKLARWFLKESGVRWLLWLHGNHDTMHSAFSTYLESIGAASVPMIDWRAQFKVTFPNGAEFRVDAAHNHKGHSMWHELHGQLKAAVFEEDADVFVSGHHHCWAHMKRELPDGRVVDLLRARGYKFLDSFAGRHQFPEQQLGASIVTIFDPLTDSPAERVRVFPCVTTGARHLTWLRQEYAARAPKKGKAA